MSHTYFQNIMHIVFSTKERRKIIPKQMKERLWAYIGGICQHQNIFVHAVGGMEVIRDTFQDDVPLPHHAQNRRAMGAPVSRLRRSIVFRFFPSAYALG